MRVDHEDINWGLRDTQLQYYLHIAEPGLLPDEEWAYKIAELQYIRKAEREESITQYKMFFGSR